MSPEEGTGPDNPYSSLSTPEISTRLRAVVSAMKVRPMPKGLKLATLVEWVVKELPAVAPDDPRTKEAIDLATVLWDHSRD